MPPARVLPDADASSRRTSKVCGSEVEVDLSFREGVVADLGLRVEACALGQAAAGLFGKAAKGSTPEELIRVAAEMRAMLREEGPPPSGERWAELVKLEPIRAYPARHASTLLVFEAAADCARQVIARAA